MQKSPLVGGFALSAMVLGWPIGATVGVRGLPALRRARRAAVRAACSCRLGSLAFHRPQPGEFAHRRGPRLARRRASAWACSSSASIILIQEIVDWSERGSVTASYPVRPQPRQHVRRDRVRRGAQFRPPAIRPRGRVLGSAPAAPGGGFGRQGDPGLRAALEQSLHLTFVSMFAVALMVAATALFLVPKVVFAPRQRARRVRADQATAFARFSPTATASVIARQKVAESERNEPKSLSTTSNLTSARPASGESALSVIDDDRHARAPGALGEVDGERRIGREADRDQRVARARLRQLFRPEAARHCR